jgi:hypothetical protein
MKKEPQDQKVQDAAEVPKVEVQASVEGAAPTTPVRSNVYDAVPPPLPPQLPPPVPLQVPLPVITPEDRPAKVEDKKEDEGAVTVPAAASSTEPSASSGIGALKEAQADLQGTGKVAVKKEEEDKVADPALAVAVETVEHFIEENTGNREEDTEMVPKKQGEEEKVEEKEDVQEDGPSARNVRARTSPGPSASASDSQARDYSSYSPTSPAQPSPVLAGLTPAVAHRFPAYAVTREEMDSLEEDLRRIVHTFRRIKRRQVVLPVHPDAIDRPPSN